MIFNTKKESSPVPRPREGEAIEEYLGRLRSEGIKTPTRAMIKTPEQIDGCREAGRVNALVLDAVAKKIEIGMSTADIDDIVVSETKRLGGKSATLGYEGFPASVCTSVGSVVCHGIPSKKQILREGDILNVDCTTVYGRYYGDASRMFLLGEVTETARRLSEISKEAVELAVSSIVPYKTRLGDIGSIIGSHVRGAGFSVVREIGGHGVGLQMHEDPFVAHTGIAGCGMVLLPGMIFTIEPMINEGKPSFYIDPRDGWTVYTADGKLSAQTEYEVLVTETGVEILSK